MIWKGKHLSISGPPVDSECQSKTQDMRSKELSIELRDRIVSRHRSGKGYQIMSAALKVPKNTVAFIILKWKKFGTTKTLPSAGLLAKLSNRGRMALVREVTNNLMVTKNPGIPLWIWKNFPERQPSLQHSTNQVFMVNFPKIKQTISAALQVPRDVTKNPRVSLTELQSSSVEIGRTFQKDNCLRSTPPIRPLR
jgi:hypothetical protein